MAPHTKQALDVIMDDESDWSGIDESESDMDVSDGEENEDLALTKWKTKRYKIFL